MGFRDAVKKMTADSPRAKYGTYVLRVETVEKVGGKDRGRHPLAGASASVESGEELRRRVTATRVLATGVFALALKKKSGGTSYLTIEGVTAKGQGFAWVEEVGRKDREKAVRFAAQVRSAALAASA